MAKREDSKLRLLAVMAILRRGKRVSSTKILQELQGKYDIVCDRKAIYDDIRAIDRFYPVEAVGGRNGGFQIVDVLKRCDDA